MWKILILGFIFNAFGSDNLSDVKNIDPEKVCRNECGVAPWASDNFTKENTKKYKICIKKCREVQYDTNGMNPLPLQIKEGRKEKERLIVPKENIIYSNTKIK